MADLEPRRLILASVTPHSYPDVKSSGAICVSRGAAGAKRIGVAGIG